MRHSISVFPDEIDKFPAARIENGECLGSAFGIPRFISIADGAVEAMSARRTRDASTFRHVITLPAIPTRREEVNWSCKCVQFSPHCQLIRANGVELRLPFFCSCLTSCKGCLLVLLSLFGFIFNDPDR